MPSLCLPASPAINNQCRLIREHDHARYGAELTGQEPSMRVRATFDNAIADLSKFARIF